ncbi:SPFH domain-containing protein [Roseofilum sp. BLCC_M91]|uniref:SPFH domain-containing protein n=1 Tax=Roseofilum halophilum BLCC-M91 TaxID=3022259 RepID=A0ABT7BDT9_9CYAN|nr:SPFH domain-containing protein [Roseofilum halophilum]MDJ1177358.1 SPFH domain-containing protein [Roseofilum halophilum BLCC-M91]
MKQTIIEQPTQPILAQNPLPQMGSVGMLLVSGSLGFVFFLILGIIAYTSVYKITPNNEAFVRTGGVFIKQKRVFLNGGCVVIPGFHEITRVPLREISIDVERTGNLAVRTQDYLRANMRVTFYVCVSANQQDVLTVAARLSKEGKISATDIKEALEKRADDAIRAAAKKKSLAEIDSDKLGFADEVLNLIQQDLKKIGLTLNNIAISEIEESDTYDENNFFDAQGVRLRTETIQKSIQQKREVELKTKVLIEQRELDAEKQSLRISREKEEANLDQKLEVESMTAQREREIQESKDQESAKIERNKLLQTKAVEEEKIQQQLSVQQSQIDANIALEERNKQLKIAQALQKQESEVAEINREKMVESSQLKARIEIAAAERESKIAQQEAAIAIVEKEKQRLVADAERAQAEAAVITAQEIEQAERAQRLTAIEAEKEAQKQRISEQNVVEIDVFRRRRQAEIARQAAELEAESIRTLAAANRDKALAEAEGEKALIEARNALSDAKLSAQLISEIWPTLAPHVPEIVKALAPQPGILGDTRIYSFPGANGNNGNGMGDINKLLMSTSGLSLVNALMEEGKLGTLLQQISQLIRNPNAPEASEQNAQAKPSQTPTKPSPDAKRSKAIAPTTQSQPMKQPSAPENPTAS